MKIGALPSPLGLQFPQWGSLVAEQLAEFGVLAPLDEAEWREWGCKLLYIPEMAFIPSPLEFESWSDWATRVLETTY